jgi:hypothetical protein
VESTVNKFEAERAELDSLLNSETFGRGGNVTKILSFVCEKYFQGSTDDITEYDIAVKALGRAGDFDPQIDTIVRVTAHLLRKRLEQFYRTEGADHSVRIYLPFGRYVPKFVRGADLKTEKIRLGLSDESDAGGNGTAPAVSTRASELKPVQLGDAPSNIGWEPNKIRLGSDEPPVARTRRAGIWTIVAVALACLCTVAAVELYVHTRARVTILPAQSEASLPVAAAASGDIVRALVGGGRAAYVDGAGQTWASDTACSGGSTVSVPYRAIGGTADPQIFLGERLGLFQCAYPVSAGTYEVHLLFSETSNLEESARIVAVSVNRGPATRLDVVFDTGGDNIETEKILTDVHPEQDGKIHIDSTSVDSYLNAVEIVPGTPNRMLPLRIYAGHTPYRDSGGNLWLPNRYFFGGRASQFEANTTGLPDGPLYATPWVGNFHYVIPVAHGETYRVRLHFRESLFTEAGSRVFDVWCNGTAILKNFDIFREAGSEPMTRTFSYVEPTKQDKIEIFFVPGVSYPLVDAIEVIPEPDTD